MRRSIRDVLARPCAAFVLSTACACTAVQPGCPREWLEFGGGVAREQGDGAIEDAWAWSVGGGYDFNADPLVVSWELSGAWSQHDVFVAGETLDRNFDVLLVATGLRLSTRLARAPLGAWVRGGWCWREEHSDDDSVPTRDQPGTYFGAGLEWWYAPGAALGPAVLWTRGADDGQEHAFLGLTARFY